MSKNEILIVAFAALVLALMNAGDKSTTDAPRVTATTEKGP